MKVPHRQSLLASWDACLAHTRPWLEDSSLGQLREVSAGTVLYTQGAPHKFFYLIREGFVQSSMLHGSGRRLLLELMGPGTLFGEGSAFDGQPRYVEMQAVTDSMLSAYTPADILAAGARTPELMADVVKVMASKQRTLAGKLLAFNNEDPESRLRRLLGTLVTVQRRTGGSDEARAQQVWLSQESLAEMCGMSRISAARALRRLANLGLVRTHARFVEVVDPAGLGAM